MLQTVKKCNAAVCRCAEEKEPNCRYDNSMFNRPFLRHGVHSMIHIYWAPLSSLVLATCLRTREGSFLKQAQKNAAVYMKHMHLVAHRVHAVQTGVSQCVCSSLSLLSTWQQLDLLLYLCTGCKAFCECEIQPDPANVYKHLITSHIAAKTCLFLASSCATFCPTAFRRSMACFSRLASS